MGDLDSVYWEPDTFTPEQYAEFRAPRQRPDRLPSGPQHGTRYRYNGDRKRGVAPCRCGLCRQAQRDYEVSRGRINPDAPRYLQGSAAAMAQASKDSSWMADAACRGLDPDLFFPHRDESSGLVPQARVVCDGCQVRGECLNYALSDPPERQGVWGGKSEKERRAMRVEHRKRIA